MSSYFSTAICTLQTPGQPIFLAAALERSICLPLMNGPRSLILTTTDLPLYVIRTFVPKGSVLCAAVSALGLNFSPLAVLLLLLHSPGLAQSYHDATVAFAVGAATSKKAVAIKV